MDSNFHDEAIFHENVFVLGAARFTNMIDVLNFHARRTRSDAAMSVGISSQFLMKPTKFVLNAVKRLFDYLKGTAQYDLPIPLKKSFQAIKHYSSSAYAGDRFDRKLRSAWPVFRNYGLFTWTTCNQIFVSLSTAKSEYVFLSDCCSDIQTIVSFLSKLSVSLDSVVSLKVHNTTAI